MLDIFYLWHKVDCPEWGQDHSAVRAHKIFQSGLRMSNDCNVTENVEVQQKETAK